MIPYQGSKRKIAKELLENIPSAENFYDLFGGGGAITKAACETGKWNNIYYNEIIPNISLLFQSLIEGTFDFEKAQKTWVSREEFHKSRLEPTAWGGFVSAVWSFGNSLDSYIYGKDLELVKQLMFNLVNMDNPFLPNTTANERRLILLKAIKNFTRIESLQRIQSLSAQQLLLKESKILENVKVTNLDYKDVTINKNSIIYCDIPYTGGGCDPRSYTKGSFNTAEFIDWATTKTVPVYFSEYEVADSRVKCVWEKEVTATLCATHCVKRSEKLYWNQITL